MGGEPGTLRRGRLLGEALGGGVDRRALLRQSRESAVAPDRLRSE